MLRTVSVAPDWQRLRAIEAQHERADVVNGDVCDCPACTLVRAGRADVARQIRERAADLAVSGKYTNAEIQRVREAIDKARREWGIV